MKIGWKHLVAVLVIGPLAALVFAWSGLMGVAANTGHWAVTDWFLHYVMRQSVETAALSVDKPAPLDPELIAPAAGHYAQGCAMCHGAPGEARSPSVMAMLPHPPDLTTVIPTWTDKQLFRIVKHGVRFTGMPAWPTQERDDEVWGIVAFLRELPDMDAATYRRLAKSEPVNEAAADNPDLRAAIEGCAACHGADGLGQSTAVPILAGQSEAYLAASLRAYVEGKRPSGNMQVAAVAVDPDLLDDLARHFAGKPGLGDGSASSDAQGEARSIAERGLPQRGVPACLSCHGGNANPLFPTLDGQNADYLARQLRLFRDEKRGGTSYSHLMVPAAKALTDSQIDALADYFAQR